MNQVKRERPIVRLDAFINSSPNLDPAKFAWTIRSDDRTPFTDTHIGWLLPHGPIRVERLTTKRSENWELTTGNKWI